MQTKNRNRRKAASPGKVDAQEISWRHARDRVAGRFQNSLGWDEERAMQCAEMAMDAIKDTFGGRQVYIPMRNGDARQKVRAEFNGRNIAELSRKYGVCTRTIRNYVK